MTELTRDQRHPLKLTKDERRRILEGDYAALKREQDPGDVEGQEIPVQRRKAHKVPLHDRKLYSDHQPKVIGTQDVPEYVSLAIELGKPVRHRRGHWQIAFVVHDRRQGDRTLRAGGPPGPPRGPGLRTRKRDRPRPKGEGVGSFTDESARGYGAGGEQVLDTGGVDDDELKRQKVKADQRFAEHREEVASDEETRRQLRATRQAINEAVRDLGLEAGTILLAGVQRLVREARDTVEDERSAA